MKKLMCLFLGSVMVLMLASHAQAELAVIGTVDYKLFGSAGTYNLIWDNDEDLIWLDYTQMRPLGWPKQNFWAQTLETGAPAGGDLPALPALGEIQWNPGYSVTWVDETWRLPTTVDNGAEGINIIDGSEFGHLFYEALGNSGYVDDQTDYGLKNTGPFENLTFDIDAGQNYRYWTNMPAGGMTSRDAYFFNTEYGYQGITQKRSYGNANSQNFAIAVRSAQISTVPVPGTGLLLAAGLAGVAAFGRRKDRE